LIGRKLVNLIVGWCGRFLFFIVPRQFSQVVGEWSENQILIPDWTYFHCPGVTLPSLSIIFISRLGWCRQREKIDWQEPGKFDSWVSRSPDTIALHWGKSHTR